MSVANRVVFNTSILYFRMMVTIGVSFYSTRIILNALGRSDYGLFNLIAGIIVMLSFLNTAMATATQRFLSFQKGKNDKEMQKRVFVNSLLLHIAIGFIIVFILEILGLFIFDGFLNIPENRIDDAKLVFHFMSATVFFSLISVPFTGSLNANEDLFWIATVNICETCLKLGIAILLLFINKDKLVIYGILTAGIGVVSFVMYAIFCFKKYSECVLIGSSNMYSKLLMKELTSFAGWNLFGSICNVARTQGSAILLNLFFGTIVNAAYGISNQISAQFRFFSLALLRVLNPQIMKSEGANDRPRMLRLSMIASKFGFFLMALLSIPCLFEMPAILSFWLKNVPEHTVIFSRLVVISILVNQLTIGLQSAAQATGNVKFYQFITGSILLLNLPVSYICLKFFHLNPESVMVMFCVVEAMACAFRLYYLQELAGLSVREYCDRVFLKEIIPVSSSIATSWLIVHYLNFNFRFVLTIAGSSAMFLIFIYLNGLCKDEKKIIDNLAHNVFQKIKIKIKGK